MHIEPPGEGLHFSAFHSNIHVEILYVVCNSFCVVVFIKIGLCGFGLAFARGGVPKIRACA